MNRKNLTTFLCAALAACLEAVAVIVFIALIMHMVFYGLVLVGVGKGLAFFASFFSLVALVAIGVMATMGFCSLYGEDFSKWVEGLKE